MAKKRLNKWYTKPASTSHSSLASTASSSFSNQKYAQPTVNELIDSLRRSDLSSIQASSAIINIPTLPPEIRHLLAQPEILAPVPRSRSPWPFNTNLGSIPAGPAAPKSWLTAHLPYSLRSRNTKYKERPSPSDINHLPGLTQVLERSLRDLCLKNMARNWDFIQIFEKYHLADLPSRLRTALLSYLCVYGPETWVGFDGLKNLLFPPNSETEECSTKYCHNQNFCRLDLSGAIGTQLLIEQVIELVRYKSLKTNVDLSDLSWEENLNLSFSLVPPLPNITHLSLSYPPSRVSWTSFLSLASNLPTLTHLSLAHWPRPSLDTDDDTVLFDRLQKENRLNMRGENSQLLDEYYCEATRILRKLARFLPGLEYLDLTGCQAWFEVLVAYDVENLYRGIEWGKHWTRLKVLKLQSGLKISKNSGNWEVKEQTQTYERAMAIELKIVGLMRESKTHGMRFTWIDVVKDVLVN